MARIGMTRLNSLPDVLSGDAFELLRGVLPGVGDSTDLTLKCQQATIAGSSNETMEVALHGHVLKFRGRAMSPRSLSVTFIEFGNMIAYKKLRGWGEFIAGSETNTSAGYKNEYSITAALIMYDTTGRVAGTQWFEKFFLSELSDISLDGTNSAPVSINATFSYDRARVDGVTMR